jgi:hypothetical protein
MFLDIYSASVSTDVTKAPLGTSEYQAQLSFPSQL